MDSEYADWRKASYSNGTGQCIETASGGGVIVVRDTVDRGGVTLSVPASAWAAFVGTLR